MNRRGFLRGIAALVGGVALNEAIPLGRVWSFPASIKIAKPEMYASFIVGRDAVVIDLPKPVVLTIAAYADYVSYQWAFGSKGELDKHEQSKTASLDAAIRQNRSASRRR